MAGSNGFLYVFFNGIFGFCLHQGYFEEFFTREFADLVLRRFRQTAETADFLQELFFFFRQHRFRVEIVFQPVAESFKGAISHVVVPALTDQLRMTGECGIPERGGIQTDHAGLIVNGVSIQTHAFIKHTHQFPCEVDLVVKA